MIINITETHISNLINEWEAAEEAVRALEEEGPPHLLQNWWKGQRTISSPSQVVVRWEKWFVAHRVACARLERARQAARAA